MIGFPGIGRHRRVRGLLSAYIDGEVTEREARRVEGHLGLCGECRMELGTLRSTVDLLGRLPGLAVRRSFALSEAPAPVASPPRFESLARLAAPVAAVLLVVLVVGDALGIVSQGGLGELAGPFSATASEGVPVEVVVEREVIAEVVKEMPVEKVVAREVQQKVADGPAGATGAVGDAPVQVAKEVRVEIASADVDAPGDEPGKRGWVLLSLTDDSGGIALPLWQIEVAVGVLLAVLLAIAFRGRRRTDR